MELEQLVERIESAFGEDVSPSGQDISVGDHEVLARVFGDDGFQDYLQDQVNRQIIRDYLTNAVVLGYVQEQSLERISGHVATCEGRSSLSLHMLMTSVEQAEELLARGVPSRLEKLSPTSNSSPHMRIVRT